LEIYTSYFYQIRFFKPYMIPLSTAVFDPKWYHEWKEQTHFFIDKNGVINGGRASTLVPNPNLMNLCSGVDKCEVRQKNERAEDFSDCKFLHDYKYQLDCLFFGQFLCDIEKVKQQATKILQLDREPIIVLIVHETPDNPCSERVAILQWLKDNAVDAKELSYPIPQYY